MADFSLNLPSWAIQLGFRLEGDYGTHGDLALWKDGKFIKAWPYFRPQPNIYEMEEFLNKYESEGEECLAE